VQEVFALCRMIDEACEDIMVMIRPAGENGKSSKAQRKLYDEFWQEEYIGSDPVESHQPRDRAPREKVRADISRIWPVNPNPHLETQIGGVLSKVFSGYVHGAYVHIMEMFGGKPAKFHTRGLLGTPRMKACMDNQALYIFRSLMAAEVVAGRVSRPDLVGSIKALQRALAAQTDCVMSKEEFDKSLRRRGNASPS
jgi:hypothetical protein